ncbi:MAG: hypothetical protein J6S10_01850, partial [Clostridia bacterium]|nr:hypothetical protein [Clostridia bacterium]
LVKIMKNKKGSFVFHKTAQTVGIKHPMLHADRPAFSVSHTGIIHASIITFQRLKVNRQF